MFKFYAKLASLSSAEELPCFLRTRRTASRCSGVGGEGVQVGEVYAVRAVQAVGEEILKAIASASWNVRSVFSVRSVLSVRSVFSVRIGFSVRSVFSVRIGFSVCSVKWSEVVAV